MSTYSKSGIINSPDSRWTGHEPDWHNWEKWSLDQFYSTKSRAIRFYTYYLSDNELKDITLKWMKKEKYSSEDIATIKNSDTGVLPSTVGKLIRSMDRGMPYIHPRAQEYYNALPFHPDGPPLAQSDYDVVKAEIKKVLKTNLYISIDDTNSTEKKVKQISPIDRIRENTRRDIIVPLEDILDKWTDTKNGVALINLADLLKMHKVPANGCKSVVDWINRYKTEYNDALEKLCSQAVESYDYLSKTDLKKIVKCLDGMLVDVQMHSKIKVSERKPRIKKTKDSGKQVAKLHYQLNSSDYNLDSISPTRIPGAQKLFCFNSKTRQISVYISKGAAGFSVKGSTLQDWNSDESFCMTLRKPADIITGILSSTPKKLDKIFDGITTVKKKVTGRINGDTILLKVIETRTI